MTADLVNDRSGVVLLLSGRKPFALVEDDLFLARSLLAFPGPWNGCDELGAAAVLDDLLCRLPLIIEFPMALWASIGGIQDRMVKERVVCGLVHRLESARFVIDGSMTPSSLSR
jgi:hypothetical protein